MYVYVCMCQCSCAPVSVCVNLEIFYACMLMHKLKCKKKTKRNATTKLNKFLTSTKSAMSFSL